MPFLQKFLRFLERNQANYGNYQGFQLYRSGRYCSGSCEKNNLN